MILYNYSKGNERNPKKKGFDIMTEIRKLVTRVLKNAEHSDITNPKEWQETFKKLAIKAVNGFDTQTQKKVCNKTTLQETVHFSQTSTRDMDILVMTVTWIEENKQTKKISLQTANCVKIFGNIY